MQLQKVIGLILIILGVGAVWWGYGLSQSLEGQVTQAIEGRDTEVMIRYGIGAVMIVLGVFFALRRS